MAGAISGMNVAMHSNQYREEDKSSPSSRTSPKRNGIRSAFKPAGAGLAPGAPSGALDGEFDPGSG